MSLLLLIRKLYHGMDQVSTASRIQGRPTQQKVIMGTLNLIQDEIEEMRAKLKECQEMILKEFDDHRSDNANMSEVHKHVITLNNHTLELLKLLVEILTGFDNAHMSEVHKHVITLNNRSLELLNLLARIPTGFDNARMSEVHKHVITINNCTLELLNLLARILIGSGQ
ncbi:uncharacterized protein LOC120005778 isoform X1 [Tripterygium wilfordii]|uniref:uncharacterized protein LOC120005778 isoform X1 n=1 Tax=Tripterygium wilfordii TaxID=458696 RepID=UPI0018F857E8|nr:uncharacterized protein LOC120005778 isoform X1 [Tripterygium wilfordii]XP_038711522.1 uncharacterized protein LOC120005778 isoform X1 [Tripterygium wilfordii]XP_038711523.1 uncharacterized protein LOC120005778 isoform X1 [Tripterygium wilfordii]XP_038711524.1 uncharacterized protein LOC120005778 isoform X1 [Tripterygium wilfordii]